MKLPVIYVERELNGWVIAMQVVKYLWEHQSDTNWIPLIHPHHLPIGVNEEITNDLTTRLERSPMRQSIGADIYNPSGREAYAQIQDDEYLAAGKPPYSTWVGRTIFLHSLTRHHQLW